MRGSRTRSGYRAEVIASIDAKYVMGQPCVYFMGWKDGPVKIGFARNLLRRWQEIQIACPYAILIWAIAEGTEAQERRYHYQFEDHRIRGEWFTRSPEIQAEIDRLNGEKRRSHLHLVSDPASGASTSRERPVRKIRTGGAEKTTFRT